MFSLFFLLYPVFHESHTVYLRTTMACEVEVYAVLFTMVEPPASYLNHRLVADVVQSQLPWLNQRVQPPLPRILPQDQTIQG